MTDSNFERRDFLKSCTFMAIFAQFSNSLSFTLDGEKKEVWKKLRKDPVRQKNMGRPDLDVILGLFPRTIGEAAFDSQEIQERIKKLRTNPTIDTGHPFLDLSVKTGLAHIDATFNGDHPKYGVGRYEDDRNDGFPPTIIAAVDALSAWAINDRAIQLFRYWLTHFVGENGTFKYYGPSISEYGQILHTAAL